MKQSQASYDALENPSAMLILRAVIRACIANTPGLPSDVTLDEAVEITVGLVEEGKVRVCWDSEDFWIEPVLA